MADAIESTPLTDDFLNQVVLPVRGVHGARQASIIKAIAPSYQAALKEFGIDNDFRVAYFTGQIVHESDQMCTTEEYASGQAYEGRRDLGNLSPGDGVKYKGRGLLQLTGKANYMHYGSKLSLDFLNHPELAAEPVTSLRVACLFWQEHWLSNLADLDDLNGITKKVNGGLNGLASRQAATDRAFKALGYDNQS